MNTVFFKLMDVKVYCKFDQVIKISINLQLVSLSKQQIQKFCPPLSTIFLGQTVTVT